MNSDPILNKHPHCGLSRFGNPFDGYDYECEYEPDFDCEECIYGPYNGSLDPEKPHEGGDIDGRESV